MAGSTPCHDCFSFNDRLLDIFQGNTFMELLIRWNWFNCKRCFIKDNLWLLSSCYFNTASHTCLRVEATIWCNWHRRWFRAILTFDITCSDNTHYTHSTLIRRRWCESQIPRFRRNSRLVFDRLEADNICILQLLHLGLATLSKEAWREDLVKKLVHFGSCLLACYTHFSHNMLHVWTIRTLIYFHFSQWNVDVRSQHYNVLPIILK